MTSANDPGYAAIITITPPGGGEWATLTLTLLPPDLVPVSGGEPPAARMHAGELAAYADSLEAEIWRLTGSSRWASWSRRRDRAVYQAADQEGSVVRQEEPAETEDRQCRRRRTAAAQLKR